MGFGGILESNKISVLTRFQLNFTKKYLFKANINQYRILLIIDQIILQSQNPNDRN